MENKYFTPDIEDIRVGYELEKYGETLIVKNLADIDEILGDLDYCPEDVRVPFLTKEQIEAEGWAVKNIDFASRYYIDKSNYMGVVETWGKFPVVSILAKDVTKIDWMSSPEMFRVTLPCKDINTFRYICKLLGI